MNRLRQLAAQPSRSSIDLSQLLSYFTTGAFTYPTQGVQQTLAGDAEPIGNNFVGYVQQAFKDNGVVFACMLARQMAFSAPRIRYQRLNAGRPGDLFGDSSLQPIEKPWPGGTTQDLLARMIQDADLAGNFYGYRDAGEIIRLRPDHVDIVLERRMRGAGQVGWKKRGYAYYEDGDRAGQPVVFEPAEVCHFAPIPDPLHSWRGMSWLTPVLREISGDSSMSRHKLKFFDNGATPNMVITYPETVTPEKIKAVKDVIDAGHQGWENAYKTLYLGGGADVEVIGRDFQQISFTATQAAGETRIAAAANVPPVIVGLSEGLQAATYSNYGQARRRFADMTVHPLWANAAGSLETILPVPAGARLWYDARDVPLLREDSKDAAEIEGRKAQTIRSLTDAGFTPDSVVAAVINEDMTLLEHSGLYSVQLQPAGTTIPDPEDGR